MEFIIAIVSSFVAIGFAVAWAMKMEEKGYHDPLVIGIGWMLLPFIVTFLFCGLCKVFGL